MTKTEARAIAERITARLFVNGFGERAQRLVMTVDGPTPRNLGGWSERAAVGQIEGVLLSADASAPEGATR